MSKVFLTTKYHKSMIRCVFVWLLLTRTGTSYFNAAGSGSVLNTYGSLTPLSVLQVAVRDGFSIKIRRWKDVKQNCCITAAVFLAKLEARLWTVAPRILILCGDFISLTVSAGEDPVRAGGPPQSVPEEGECRALLQRECPTTYILTGFRGRVSVWMKYL